MMAALLENPFMQELRDILEPTWGAETWLLEGWNQLTNEEKSQVRARMDDLFQHGLPFTLEHDKMSYIRLFSLLAQLEVLAIQVPLKFASLSTSPEIRQQMRQQLLDEVFHGLVFTKISFMLSAPYAYPPAYSSEVEELCNFVRNESCSKTAVILLNLIAEGWIETLFDILMKNGVAPEVFSVILADEKRHVNEADLYCATGIPTSQSLRDKIVQIETLLLNNLLGNYRLISLFAGFSINKLTFIDALNQKYLLQLKKIGCQPGHRWSIFTKLSLSKLSQFFDKDEYSEPVALSLTRKILMTQWKNPQDPTMVGDFDLDITDLNYFSRPDRNNLISFYLLQTISKLIADKNELRRYINHNQQRQVKGAYVSLVNRLPHCDGVLSYIVFENCHQLTHQALQARIKSATAIQVMCFQRRQALEEAKPHLRQKFERIYYDLLNGVYPFTLPMQNHAIVSVSNIGAFGYTGAKSPLLPNEAFKVTLLKVERRPVWDEGKQHFVSRDMLPITFSADHRVLDGNLPLPLLTRRAFESVHAKWLQDEKEDIVPPESNLKLLNQYIDYFLTEEVELAHTLLSVFQVVWFDRLLQRDDKSNHLFDQMIKSILDDVDPLLSNILFPA